MIKRFISKLSETSTEAMLAILHYIDDKLDEHDNKLEGLEKRINDFEEGFNPTKVEVESQTETRKLIKKTVITGITGAVIGYILNHFGIF